MTQTGLTVQLLYGDSHTGTHAFGPIVKDTVGIAGLSVKDLFLAAIVDTNTTTYETGSAGILGLGFPAIRFGEISMWGSHQANECLRSVFCGDSYFKHN